MKRERGFSLIELMTALTVMSFVIAGITQVLIKQSQASQSQSLQRDLEESGRLALLELALNIRRAGYGITPLAAFDFDRYACTTPGTPATCNGGGNQRDRIDGPDELVISYREPDFSRAIASYTATSPTTVTFTTPLTTSINAGVIFQLVAPAGGAVDYLALNSTAAVGATSVSLRLLTNADGYYTPSVTPPATTASGNFAGGYLTMVDRIRYFVAADTDGVPTLWKERGNGNEKLYRGIEDLQFTYTIGQPPTGSAFAATVPPASCGGVAGWVFGACPGTATQPLETATAPDWQNDLYDSANRYTAHPCNIRSVGINIVARSIANDPTNVGDPVPVVGDRAARVADVYKRTILLDNEQPENLLARQIFMPIILAGVDPSVGGG